MKARVLTKVTIAAEPAEVFKYLKNLKYHHLWNPLLRSISPVIILKAGSVYETSRIVLSKQIKAINTVTKFLDNKELELENTTGMVHYKVNYRLITKNGKTQLSCNTTVDSQNKAFAFAKPVLAMLARRELQSDLQALKIAVEQNLE